jgi:hypothetical protein
MKTKKLLKVARLSVLISKDKRALRGLLLLMQHEAKVMQDVAAILSREIDLNSKILEMEQVPTGSLCLDVKKVLRWLRDMRKIEDTLATRLSELHDLGVE